MELVTVSGPLASARRATPVPIKPTATRKATTAQTNLTNHFSSNRRRGRILDSRTPQRNENTCASNAIASARPSLRAARAGYARRRPAVTTGSRNAMKIHNPFRLGFVATLGVGLAIILLQSIESLSTVLLYVGTALFISLGLDPLVSWLSKKWMPRWVAVLIAIVVGLAAFAGILLIVVPVLVAQLSQLVRRITLQLNRSDWQTAAESRLREWFPNLDVPLVFDAINDWLTNNIFSISENVLNATFGLANALFGAFIVLILTIYLTASTPSLKSAIYQMVPASRRPIFMDIGNQITDSVAHYVMGQVSLAATNGLLSALFLTIIDAPFAMVLAVIAFIGSMIPP